MVVKVLCIPDRETGSCSCRKGHVRLGGTEGQWLFDGCDRKDCEENEQIEGRALPGLL